MQNAENALDVETSPLEKISGIIFDLGNDGKIPEGDYLNLMNSMKKLYDDMKKPVYVPPIYFNNMTMSSADRVRMTRYYESKLFILRRIEMRDLEGNREVGFRAKCLSILRSGFVGITIRIFSTAHFFKFMRITKINEKSIRYDILYMGFQNEGKIKRNCKLTFKQGEYFIDFSDYKTKQILFYSTSNIDTNNLINDFNINWENAVVDNNLSIWN
jgi:hypothetical protein